MKRGELSMEVIIIAAIALLVLVILTVLILRQTGKVSDQTGCESSATGGQCVVEGECDAATGIVTQSCTEEGYVCCVPIKSR